VGPLRFWLNFGFKWNTDQEKVLSHALNIQAKDDYHIGYDIESDLTKLTKAFGVLAFKHKEGDFFFKSECLKKHLYLGCNHGHKDCCKHSFELMYDHSKETEGIWGKPVTVKSVCEKKLNDNVTMKSKIELSKEINATFSHKQKFDDKVSATFSDTVNLTQVWKDPSKAWFNWGIEMKYEL